MPTAGSYVDPDGVWRPSADGIRRAVAARRRLRVNLDAQEALRWTTSASALELYASCPYRFFVERVLRLGEPQDTRDELDARGAGQLGHEAVAAVFESLESAGRLPVVGGEHAAEEDRITRAAVETVLERWTRQQPVGVRPFFELEGDEMIMVQSLPQSDPAWILDLEREEAPGCIDHADEVIESRVFEFACGCTAEKLADALLRMWGQRPDDLFEGQEGIEVSCPRCGTRWFIDRGSFDAEWEKHRAEIEAEGDEEE